MLMGLSVNCLWTCEFLMRAQGHLARIGRSLRGRPAAHEVDRRTYFGAASVPAAYQAFLDGMYRALQAYRPEPYEGNCSSL